MVELIKRALRALKERRARIGWAFAEGAIGAGVGLLLAMAYLRCRGW